ncbi:MAG: KpsF/GutQ family sugar-phosphate isomerase [Desulfobacteraceae bacterium]|nr:KpsF/GutQ family sugar-phosphate isomerase [Desulfobacteraceae bacterium]MCF8095038.1 KpsF/GutQ family sugar-phosphate isomerase [Desulfobacteraceae bacterium]
MSIERAKEVLRIEADGIIKLADKLDESFSRLVELIYKLRGRVIVAGIGKSGLIARKIVATLNSTGTRSLFLHPVEAMHGDLGIVSADDVFIAISNSGETDELNILISSIRAAGCPVTAFTGNPNSSLASRSDIVINVGVEKEACPLGLAPTASTSAQMAMGDALAVVLIEKRKFSPSDFHKFHPGGNLGHRLAHQVSDIMLTGKSVPKVLEGTDMETALAEMDSQKLGVIFIIDYNDILTGIITDGDVRRMVIRKTLFEGAKVENLMVGEPKHVDPAMPLYEALNIMETHQITILPAIDEAGKLVGALHLHDILGKGALKFNPV